MLDPFSAAEGYIGNDLGELTVTAVRFLRGYRYVSHAKHTSLPLSRSSLSPFSLQNRGTLIIGHHKLEGKLVDLPRPLCMLRKRAAADGESAGDAAAAVHYVVAGLVKRKLVFKNRPKPIVKRKR